MKKIISSAVLLLVFQSSMGFAKLECDKMNDLVLTCSKLQSPAKLTLSDRKIDYTYTEDSYFEKKGKFIVCKGKEFSGNQGPVTIKFSNINFPMEIEAQGDSLFGEFSSGVEEEIKSFLVNFEPSDARDPLNLKKQKYIRFSKSDEDGTKEALYKCE